MKYFAETKYKLLAFLWVAFIYFFLGGGGVILYTFGGSVSDTGEYGCSHGPSAEDAFESACWSERFT